MPYFRKSNSLNRRLKWKNTRVKLLFPYWACRLLGGVAAGGCVLHIFHTPIAGYEVAHSILRSRPESIKRGRNQ